MKQSEIIRKYLAAMEQGDLAETFACFDEGATVVSPVYGAMDVVPFYEKLYGDTVSASVNILDIYCSTSDENKWVAHFDYGWERRDGKKLASNLVDIFRFSEKFGKISHLQIVFDRGAMT